jgi:aldehyde dehydrogenase (NAD+)
MNMQVESHNLEQVTEVYKAQRTFFDSGATRSTGFRKAALKKLYNSIKAHQKDIIQAMQLDYGKPELEGYLGDVAVVLEELKYTIRHLGSWMKPSSIGTPLPLLPAGSRIVPEPRGLVVAFAPWNYPFNLAITPVIGAVAAGNCVMVKPAHETPHTALMVQRILQDVFPPEHVWTVMGEGRHAGELLLSNFTFNHIFFTGSATVGKWIMEKAAQTLTPVTLELGGKCPSIIDKNCNLDTALNRITWSKFFNAGQTCLATDHVLVHESMADACIEGIISRIKRFYGEDASQSPHFSRIVNIEKTIRVSSFLDQGEVLHGGRYDIPGRYIEPTVLRVTDMNLPIMNEEIFGPVLPIVVWKDRETLLEIVRRNRYPLACYVFSADKEFIRFITDNVESGGLCINDAMIHYANTGLPFGGVMQSGAGKYHGRYSFETFSNMKSVMNVVTAVDLHPWYPPYTETKRKIIEKFVG